MWASVRVGLACTACPAELVGIPAKSQSRMEGSQWGLRGGWWWPCYTHLCPQLEISASGVSTCSHFPCTRSLHTPSAWACIYAVGRGSTGDCVDRATPVPGQEAEQGMCLGVCAPCMCVCMCVHVRVCMHVDVCICVCVSVQNGAVVI